MFNGDLPMGFHGDLNHHPIVWVATNPEILSKLQSAVESVPGEEKNLWSCFPPQTGDLEVTESRWELSYININK